MPALISDHSHLGVVKDGKISSENYTAENIEAALRQYEAYGATTVLSLGVNKDLLYGWRARQRAGEFGGAEVFTADQQQRANAIIAQNTAILQSDQYWFSSSRPLSR
jgi:hypothetical protein